MNYQKYVVFVYDVNNDSIDHYAVTAGDRDSALEAVRILLNGTGILGGAVFTAEELIELAETDLI